MLNINEQYSLLEKSDKLELKELALLIVTKEGAKYKNKSWNDYSKLAAYLVKEFCNKGQIKDTSTDVLKDSISTSKANVNRLLLRLIDSGYIHKYQSVAYTVNTKGSKPTCKLSKSQYTLIPTSKLLDLIDTCGFSHPDRETICSYKEQAKEAITKVTVIKSTQNDIDVTTTITTDAFGNRTEKIEVNVDEAMDKIDELHNKAFEINNQLAFNGQELNMNPVDPLIDMDGDDDC